MGADVLPKRATNCVWVWVAWRVAGKRQGRRVNRGSAGGARRRQSDQPRGEHSVTLALGRPSKRPPPSRNTCSSPNARVAGKPWAPMGQGRGGTCRRERLGAPPVTALAAPNVVGVSHSRGLARAVAEGNHRPNAPCLVRSAQRQRRKVSTRQTTMNAASCGRGRRPRTVSCRRADGVSVGTCSTRFGSPARARVCRGFDAARMVSLTGWSFVLGCRARAETRHVSATGTHFQQALGHASAATCHLLWPATRQHTHQSGVAARRGCLNGHATGR